MYILYSISGSFKLSVSSTIQTSPMLNCGTHCHPLLSLNPTICHLLNLTSTNLILSPFLLKLPLIFSVFPLSGLCYRPYSLSPTLLTKIKTKNSLQSLSHRRLIAYLSISYRYFHGYCSLEIKNIIPDPMRRV